MSDAPPAPSATPFTLGPRALLAASFVGTLLLAVVASPALRGGRIYDDLRMQDHRFMDDPSDVLAVFQRNSADYLRPDPLEPRGVGTYTYRPLAMLGLVATEVATHDPVAHHLVSFALELGVLILLYQAWRALGARREPAFVGVAIVGASPALAESWLFVNGRADLQALLFVLAFTLVLARIRREGVTAPRALGLLLCALGATLSKETAIVALPFAAFVVAGAIPAGGSRGTPAIVGLTSVVWLLATIALLGGRSLSAAHFEGAGGTPAPIEPWLWLSRAPRLAALGAADLLVPGTRVMRCLAYELTRPLGPLDFVGFAALGLGLFQAYRTRSLGLAAALVAIPLVLAPCAFVADTFWLGFDRYLGLAFAPLALALPRAASLELAPKVREWLQMGSAAFLVLSSAALFQTARAYADQEAFVDAMIATRSADPTGYFLRARGQLLAGQTDAARETVTSAPEASDSIALEATRIDLFADLGDQAAVLARADELFARAPNDPRALTLQIYAEVGRRDLAGALRVARRVLRDPDGCLRAVDLFRSLRSIPTLPAADAAAIDAYLRRAGDCR